MSNIARGNTVLGTWTRIAIENGGVLHVVHNRWGYRASVIWPQLPAQEPVEGDGKSLDEAFVKLEQALMEDAADEMTNNPNSGV